MSDPAAKLRAMAMTVFVVMGATFALATMTVPAAAANEPVISGVYLDEAGNQEIKFSFQSDEQLGSSPGDVAVSVDGPNSANVYTFDRTDFSEFPDGMGGYVYELSATQAYDDGDGNYVATVDDAKDGSGNNGGNNGAGSGLSNSYSYTSDSVTAQSFAIESGAGDKSKITLNAQYSQPGMLSVQFRNNSGGYDLSTAGVDDTTTLKATLTVDGNKPRAMIGNGQNVDWTRTDNGDGTWDVEVTAEPTEANFKFSPTPNTFDGSYQANVGADKALVLSASDLSFMNSDRRDRLDGMLFMTDAQSFGPPKYNDTGDQDAIEFDLGAPHLTTDGSVNEGFAEVFLTDAMLNHWDVDPADVTGRWKGSDRTTTITEVDGGAFAKISVTYSEDTAQYTIKSSTPSVSVSVPDIPDDAFEDDDSSTPTPTPAPTPTPPATSTPTATATATPVPTTAAPTEEPPGTVAVTVDKQTEAAPTTPGQDGPGFTLVLSLLALLGIALLAARRRR